MGGGLIVIIFGCIMNYGRAEGVLYETVKNIYLVTPIMEWKRIDSVNIEGAIRDPLRKKILSFLFPMMILNLI